jgi:hypothetical protein
VIAALLNISDNQPRLKRSTAMKEKNGIVEGVLCVITQTHTRHAPETDSTEPLGTSYFSHFQTDGHANFIKQ